MATILKKYWQIENQCHSLLNKDFIIILANHLQYTFHYMFSKKLFFAIIFLTLSQKTVNFPSRAQRHCSINFTLETLTNTLFEVF